MRQNGNHVWFHMTDTLWLLYDSRVNMTPYHLCNIAATLVATTNSTATALQQRLMHSTCSGKEQRSRRVTTAAILDAIIGRDQDANLITFT